MDTTWVPAVHYTSPRESKVRKIVLHWMVTNLAGCDRTFTSGLRRASAHYGIEDATVHQYVKEGDAAWHAGQRAVNHESIGIEHSAQPGRDATEATIATSIALCTEICKRYGLGADAIHQHNEFYATQCPGTIPVARIREAVRKNLAQPVPTPAPPKPTPAPAPKGLNVKIIDLRDVSPYVTGPGVKPLQRLLGVPADGLAGSGTRAALGRAQVRIFGKADYMFGPATAAALLAGK
jgi:hypothetical protein